MANVQLSANIEVSVKPRVGLAVLFTLLVVLFAIALVAGMVVGRLYLAILLIPIAFFLRLLEGRGIQQKLSASNWMFLVRMEI